jgi:EAL domain-containing protein (putative c-di-GMP-specific phosphodiesterase class I)
VGAEALVRWQHPRLGLLSPDTFIGLAEECGLIVEIDGWVLGEACRQAGAWLAEGLPSVRMAVNVASNDLRQDGLADRVADVLATTGLEGSQLELEISERVAETTGDTLSDVLAGLGALGVRLAIDDFGTGNSTFGRLTHRHLHTVKIDQSFLESVVDETSNAPLVVALLGLGQSLGLTVVAEGVETEGQVAFLRQHGCELAQGYLFARPLTADAFAQLLGHSNPIAASW